MVEPSAAPTGPRFGNVAFMFVWLFFSLIFWQRLNVNVTSDLHLHIEYAKKIHAIADITSPHFVFQLVIKSMAATHLLSYEASACVVLGLCYAVMALMLFHEAWRRVPGANYWVILIGSFSTLIAAHIFIFTIDPPHFYYGYLVQTAYHNPSQQLNKAFALAVWILYVRAFLEGNKLTPSTGCIIALLCILSAVAKPSFLIAFLPMAGLMAACDALNEKWSKVVSYISYVALPTCLILTAQFLFTFGGEASDGGGVVFEPFAVVSSKYLITLPLAILFPILALAFSRRHLSGQYLWLAFLYLAIGIAYTILLAEGGARKFEGNFAWTAQTGAFLCFVEAFLLSLRETGWRRNVLYTALAIHVIFGVIYVAANAFVPAPLWL